MIDFMRLPHLSASPALPKLLGDELFEVVRVRERNFEADRGEVFGTYQNSVTARTIKQFCAVSVGPERPGHPVLGEIWRDPRDGETYIFLGEHWASMWTPSKRLPAGAER